MGEEIYKVSIYLYIIAIYYNERNRVFRFFWLCIIMPEANERAVVHLMLLNNTLQ